MFCSPIEGEIVILWAVYKCQDCGSPFTLHLARHLTVASIHRWRTRTNKQQEGALTLEGEAKSRRELRSRGTLLRVSRRWPKTQSENESIGAGTYCAWRSASAVRSPRIDSEVTSQALRYARTSLAKLSTSSSCGFSPTMVDSNP